MQQHVVTTRCSDKSLRVYWRIFVKIFVSATEFCHSNMLQKIKSDRICATCRHDKILFQGQRFFSKFLQYTRSDLSPQHVAATSCRTCTHGVICRRNWLLQLSPSVYRPLYNAFSSSLQRYVCPRDEHLVH